MDDFSNEECEKEKKVSVEYMKKKLLKVQQEVENIKA